MAAPVFDAATTSNATGDLSFTHTPVGTPRAVVVHVAQDLSSADLLTTGVAVKYGALTISRVRSDARVAGELGRTYLYFAGSSIPTGAQTVTIDSDSGTIVMAAVVQTWTATTDTELATDNGTNGIFADPAVTLATLAGFDGVCTGILFSGVSSTASITAGSGYTKRGEFDFGVTVCSSQSGPKSGANVNFNYTVVSDDVALSAAAIQEQSGVAPPAFSRPAVVTQQAVQRASIW